MDIRGKRVVIFGGKTGLLGQALVRAFTEAGAETIPLGSGDTNVLDPASVKAALDEYEPRIVINATGYTLVDMAEDEPEKAFALNGEAPAIMARAATACGALFIHYSTDFVFSGRNPKPHSETDATGPLSVYGRSKLQGEQAVLDIAPDNSLVLRISWLFGPDKMNIIRKFLALAKDREHLTVINDQFGSPSYTPDVAENTLALIEHDARGLFHLANLGTTSWFELAAAAIDLSGIPCAVDPIPTSAYPTKAVRPPSSILAMDKFTLRTKKAPRHWREALDAYIQLLRSRGDLNT